MMNNKIKDKYIKRLELRLQKIDKLKEEKDGSKTDR